MAKWWGSMVNPNCALASLARPRNRRVGRLDHLPALLADEVPVRRSREVVRRGPVAKVRVDDHAQSLELVEVAIDGRKVDVGRLLLHLGRQVLRRVVALGVEQGPQQQAARRRDPPALLAHDVEDAFDRGGVSRVDHRGTLGLAHARSLLGALLGVARLSGSLRPDSGGVRPARTSHTPWQASRAIAGPRGDGGAADVGQERDPRGAASRRGFTAGSPSKTSSPAP